MKLKRFIAVILALTLVLSLGAAALACGHSHGGSRARPHVCADADWDGWCDGCGASRTYGGRGHRSHHGRC